MSWALVVPVLRTAEGVSPFVGVDASSMISALADLVARGVDGGIGVDSFLALVSGFGDALEVDWGMIATLSLVLRTPRVRDFGRSSDKAPIFKDV